MRAALSPATLSLKEALELYENGKHRRYSLLFAVNGGAFAIAKLLAGETPAQARVLGNLTLTELAIGMAMFTIVMTVDIYKFGEKMQASYLEDAFQPAGKAVLVLLGALQCVGWLLVGLR